MKNKKVAAKRHGLTQCDIIRISKNYGYMASQLPSLPEREWETAAKAVLEHHFDCHQYCGDWCKRKCETPAERESSTKFYRKKSHKVDQKLYDDLHTILSPFSTLEKLKEIAHGMDTQVNESLNNTISWLAPKNKTYSGTNSLKNRIDIAVSINSLGYDVYFEMLFEELGIDMTPSSKKYFDEREKQRHNHASSQKTTTAKKKRNKKLYEKLRAHTEKTKKDYKTGIGFTIGPAVIPSDDNQIPAVTQSQGSQLETSQEATDADECDMFDQLGFTQETDVAVTQELNALDDIELGLEEDKEEKKKSN